MRHIRLTGVIGALAALLLFLLIIVLIPVLIVAGLAIAVIASILSIPFLIAAKLRHRQKDKSAAQKGAENPYPGKTIDAEYEIKTANAEHVQEKFK